MINFLCFFVAFASADLFVWQFSSASESLSKVTVSASTFSVGPALSSSKSYTSAECSTTQSSAFYACVVGDFVHQLTSWNNLGQNISSVQLGFDFENEWSDNVMVHVDGSNAYVTQTDSQNVTTITLYKNGQLPSVVLNHFTVSSGLDLAPVDFSTFSNGRLWFGIGSRGSHWDRKPYSIYGVDVSGSNLQTIVIDPSHTGQATYNKCLSVDANTLTCFAKVDQAGGPWSVYSINTLTGETSAKCSDLQGVPHTMWGDSFAFDTASNTFSFIGYDQKVPQIPATFVQVTACNAKILTGSSASPDGEISRLFYLA